MNTKGEVLSTDGSGDPGGLAPGPAVATEQKEKAAQSARIAGSFMVYYTQDGEKKATRKARCLIQDPVRSVPGLFRTAGHFPVNSS